MQTSSRPMRLYDRIVRPGADGTNGGIWRIDGDDVVAIERYDVGPTTVLVPGELVLVLAVDLPLPGRRKRIEALPFAIEDALAEPVASVHLALGMEIAPRRHLVGVVAHAAMRRWITQLDAAGLSHAALVPDALALPIPAPGFWSVEIGGGRAVVRLDDRTGFAVPLDRLAATWTAGGAPPCVACGDPLPAGIAVADSENDAEGLSRRLLLPPLDLRQGAYARPREARGPWRRLAIVAAFGLVAHTAIAAADTVALQRVAAQREAETRAIVAQSAPNLAASEDIVSAASDLLPSGTAAPSRLFPLLARTSSALGPLAAQVTLRDLSWAEADGALSLDLDAPDLATLQRVQSALDAAGLKPEAGAAAAGDGSAEGKVTVRDPTGGSS